MLCASSTGSPPPAQQDEKSATVPAALPSLLWQSTRLERTTLNVNSWPLFGIATAATVASLAAFNALATQIVAASVAAGYSGAPGDLLILDLRFGYSPETVTTLLQAWGPTGRHLYLVCYCLAM